MWLKLVHVNCPEILQDVNNRIAIAYILLKRCHNQHERLSQLSTDSKRSIIHRIYSNLQKNKHLSDEVSLNNA